MFNFAVCGRPCLGLPRLDSQRTIPKDESPISDIVIDRLQELVDFLLLFCDYVGTEETSFGMSRADTKYSLQIFGILLDKIVFFHRIKLCFLCADIQIEIPKIAKHSGTHFRLRKLNCKERIKPGNVITFEYTAINDVKKHLCNYDLAEYFIDGFMNDTA